MSPEYCVTYVSERTLITARVFSPRDSRPPGNELSAVEYPLSCEVLARPGQKE